MPEIIDILNDNLKVIGQDTKEHAHQQGLLHACVVAELIDPDGNWTLVKQASDRQDAGQYVSPVGGHIRAGESYIDALKRETFEELGIREFNSKFIGQKIFNRNVIGRKENHLFILCEIYSDQTPTLNHESVSFQKFSSSQLKTKINSNPYLFGEAFHFVTMHFYPEFRNIQ